MKLWDLLRESGLCGTQLSVVTPAPEPDDEAITLHYPSEELEALRRMHAETRGGSQEDAPSQQ